MALFFFTMLVWTSSLMLEAFGLKAFTETRAPYSGQWTEIRVLLNARCSTARAWERLLHFARVFSHDLRPSFTSTSSKANRFWSPSPYRIHDVKPSRRRRPIPLKLLKLEVSYILGLVLTVCLCDCHIIFGRCVNGNWSSAKVCITSGVPTSFFHFCFADWSLCKFGFTGIVFTSNTRSSAAVGTL